MNKLQYLFRRWFFKNYKYKYINLGIKGNKEYTDNEIFLTVLRAVKEAKLNEEINIEIKYDHMFFKISGDYVISKNDIIQ